MAVTKSNKSNITSPNGNSLALFVDINDDKLKMKDINGEVQPLDDFVSVSGGTLQIEGGALINATLQNVTDAENNVSQLQLATNATKINGNLEVASDLDVGANTNIDGNTLILGTLEVDNTTKIKTANETYLDIEDGGGNNRFTIGKATGSQKVTLDYASNPTSSTEIVGSIRTYQNGTILSDIATFRRDGQVTFVERVNVEADSLVTTQTSSVIASTTTNANMVIAPNGTGALVASIPDGTTTGGNARGNSAVDLQTSRSSNLSVASGTRSVVLGGSNNSARATESVCVGGSSNNAQQLQSFIGGGNSNLINGGTENAIVGGTLNTNSGVYGFIGAGLQNVVSSGYSTISGGQSNTASTGTHATVVGGSSNTSSGQRSVSGGSNSTASGSRAIAIGESAVATGSNSVCIGGGLAQGVASTALAGAGNNAVKDYSLAQGYVTESQLRGQVAFSGTAFTFPSERGYCQQSLLTANREATLTTGGTTTLSLDGTGTTNLIIPFGNNRMWKVKVEYVGTITTITGTATGLAVGNSVYGEANFGFKRVGGTSSMGSFINDSQASDNAIMDTCSLAYSAGASQELALTFTGPTFAGGGSVTMRVVAKVSLVEVAY